MPDKQSEQAGTRLPQGFTIHTSGLASEYAREQGWGINEDERTKTPRKRQSYDGGRNYEYGPRDFGDVPEDTRAAMPGIERNRAKPAAGRSRKAA
jgi:hypothetical protein